MWSLMRCAGIGGSSTVVSVPERLLLQLGVGEFGGGLWWRHGECRRLSCSVLGRSSCVENRSGSNQQQHDPCSPLILSRRGCHDVATSSSFSATGVSARFSSTVIGASLLSSSVKYASRGYNTGTGSVQQRQHGGNSPPPCRFFSSVSSPSQDMTSVNNNNTIEAVEEEESMQRKVPVYDLNRMEIGTMLLPEDVFGVPVRIDILHRVVRWQLARRQQGTHKTKTRSEVSGGGRKPWQQKGSGRARQGTIRAPQWRGGGIVHGPVVRSHAHKLQKRVRRLGLQCAVSAKVSEGRFLVVDSLTPEDGKTSTVKGHVDALLDGAPRQSVLFVDDAISDELKLGSRNLPWVDTVPVHGLNVYSILQRDYLVMSRNAIDAFIERIRKPIRPCSFTP